MKKIETTSQTDWNNLPQEWRNVAVDSVINAGRGETELSVVAIIASALYNAFGTMGILVIKEPINDFNEDDEPLSAIQEAFNRGEKGVTERPEDCTCIQDESRGWIECPVHGPYWQARMNSGS